MERGREGERERGREGEREGERERGREGGRHLAKNVHACYRYSHVYIHMCTP